FPGLQGIQADYFWQGWLSIARDKNPHICLSADRSVAYSLGCTGTGVAMATHAGKLLAKALAGECVPELPQLIASPLPRFEVPVLRKIYQRAAYSYYYIKDEFF